MKLFCCICNGHTTAVLVSGKKIYPHRFDLYKLHFYQCPICKGYVGTHLKTLEPLGCIVSSEVKKARTRIHNIIDPLWTSGKIKRKELYKKISNHIGKEFHVAEIKTTNEAEQIIKLIAEK